jgi:hypothetical protein
MMQLQQQLGELGGIKPGTAVSQRRLFEEPHSERRTWTPEIDAAG